MSEVSRRINESWDLDTVLQEVVDGACSLTGARYGAVGLFDDSGHIRNFITSHELPQSGSSPGESALLGYLNDIREPPRLVGLTCHSRSIGFP